MAPRIKMIVILNLFWSEFVKTNERRFDLLLQILITHLGPRLKKSGAGISAQLTILCSINRKLRSGDYKQIGVRFFVLSLSFVLKQRYAQTKVNKSQTQ